MGFGHKRLPYYPTIPPFDPTLSPRPFFHLKSYKDITYPWFLKGPGFSYRFTPEVTPSRGTLLVSPPTSPSDTLRTPAEPTIPVIGATGLTVAFPKGVATKSRDILSTRDCLLRSLPSSNSRTLAGPLQDPRSSSPLDWRPTHPAFLGAGSSSVGVGPGQGAEVPVRASTSASSRPRPLSLPSRRLLAGGVGSSRRRLFRRRRPAPPSPGSRTSKARGAGRYSDLPAPVLRPPVVFRYSDPLAPSWHSAGTPTPPRWTADASAKGSRAVHGPQTCALA